MHGSAVSTMLSITLSIVASTFSALDFYNTLAALYRPCTISLDIAPDLPIDSLDGWNFGEPLIGGARFLDIFVNL